MATGKKQHTVRFAVNVHGELRARAALAGRAGKGAFGEYVADFVVAAVRAGVDPRPAPAGPPSGRPGRQAKGDRVAQTVRFTDLDDVKVQRAAASAGYRELGPFIADLVAGAVAGRHVAPPAAQQPLPLDALSLSA
jgi:hypothetical protein